MSLSVSSTASVDPQSVAQRRLLRSLFDAAVAAAHPDLAVPPALPAPPASGRILLLSTGKAGGSMMAAAVRHYRETLAVPAARLFGLGVARHGYEGDNPLIPVRGAGHPMPDQASLAATEETLAIAASARPEDIAVVLISGGGSANWIAPVAGLSLADKQAINRTLLRSGAPISDVNAVRKHLSRIKGGRLAATIGAGRIHTLAISDVPGDDPSTIASGPTVPDPITLAEARAIIARNGMELPAAADRALSDDTNETPKPGDPIFDRTHFSIITRPRDALAAAVAAAARAGYRVIDRGPDVEGEAREVARRHAAEALALKAAGTRAIILSGGELTVTIRGQGHGGPNQEYALALAIALDGAAGIAALAADTDGTDGGRGDPADPAGAVVDATTLVRAAALGRDPAAMLADNDSTGFFAALGDLVQTGPTLTNANDLRAILVEP
jgi:hydroxypyruvate reductase